MRKTKIIVLSLILQNCSNKDNHIRIEFLSDEPVFDTVLVDEKPLILNEYYSVVVENTLFDTIYLGLNKMNNSNKVSFHPSEIMYFKGGEKITGKLIFVGKPDTFIAIPMFCKSNLLFLLPEYNDTSAIKRYSFLFNCDSVGTLRYKYFDLSSEHATGMQILEMH